MSQMTVFTGPERRRRWSDYDRARILRAAFSPGAVVAEVARQNDVATSLIYKWRAEAREEISFAPVVVSAEPVSAVRSRPADGAAILVEFADGARVSVAATAPAALVVAALGALRR